MKKEQAEPVAVQAQIEPDEEAEEQAEIAEGAEEEEKVVDHVQEEEEWEYWIVDYAWDCKKPFRSSEKHKKREYGEAIPRKDLPGTAQALARWPDGYEKQLDQAQFEVWPELFPAVAANGGSTGLPKSGKKKKKGWCWRFKFLVGWQNEEWCPSTHYLEKQPRVEHDIIPERRRQTRCSAMPDQASKLLGEGRRR